MCASLVQMVEMESIPELLWLPTTVLYNEISLTEAGIGMYMISRSWLIDLIVIIGNIATSSE